MLLLAIFRFSLSIGDSIRIILHLLIYIVSFFSFSFSFGLFEFNQIKLDFILKNNICVASNEVYFSFPSSRIESNSSEILSLLIYTVVVVVFFFSILSHIIITIANFTDTQVSKKTIRKLNKYDEYISFEIILN